MKKSWHPMSNGAGKRHWFVCDGMPGNVLEDSRGQYFRFGSYEAAKARADKMNATGERGTR